MAAEGFPVSRIDEYAKPYEPAIHVLRSVLHTDSHRAFPVESILNEWIFTLKKVKS